MAVIGISTIRNEEDILPETLPAWAEALDLVLVVDCGSTDESASIARECAARYRNVHFVGAIGPHHARQVRRHVWEHFRQHLTAADWWMMADADEFVEPGFRHKLQVAERAHADHVFSEHVNFYYTEAEYRLWEAGMESLADRARPVAQRRRWYRCHTTQRRLFRNLPWLRWNTDTSFPERLARHADDRIRFFHYQYRDPVQIEVRIAVRSSIPANDEAMRENSHWRRRHPEQAYSRDPLLQYLEPGCEGIIHSELPPLAPQSRVRTAAKYGLAMLEGLLYPQTRSTLFPHLDVRGALEAMRRCEANRPQQVRSTPVPPCLRGQAAPAESRRAAG